MERSSRKRRKRSKIHIHPVKGIKIDVDERKLNLVTNNDNPWVNDISFDVLQVILQRLSLLDRWYRFGFVCKRWHEPLHCRSRRPPCFPLLITSERASFLQLHDILRSRLFDRKLWTSNRFQRVWNLDDNRVELNSLLDGDERLSEYMVVVASHKGWILMVAYTKGEHGGFRMLLLNPILRAKINLPDHSRFISSVCLVVTSCSNDLQVNFFIVFHDSSDIYFGKNGDCCWSKMTVSHYENKSNEPHDPQPVRYSFAFCDGRVYGMATSSDTLVTFDPFGDQGTTLDILPMKNVNVGHRMNRVDKPHINEEFLVESAGELLMVNVVCCGNCIPCKSFPLSELTQAEVFRANFDKMEWTKVTDSSNCLVDRVLFVSKSCCFSAEAKNVGVEGGAQIHFVYAEWRRLSWFWLQFDLRQRGIPPKLRMQEAADDDYQPLWFQPQHYCSCKISVKSQ